MRQRKLKNLEARYEGYEDIIIEEPAKMRGRWSELSGGRPLYVEIGCGKGKFISELAAREPGNYFAAIEGNKSVMLRAMQKIRALGLTNVIFIPELAGDLSEWFAPCEAAGIYLNFSDPLPKNYWNKRRLTYRDRLTSYFKVLAQGGTVTFKTDNTDLFNWSLTEIAAADLKILDITRDLHADPDKNAENIETEYEAKYSGFGEKIKRVIIGRKTEDTAGMAAADGDGSTDTAGMAAADGGGSTDTAGMAAADGDGSTDTAGMAASDGEGSTDTAGMAAADVDGPTDTAGAAEAEKDCSAGHSISTKNQNDVTISDDVSAEAEKVKKRVCDKDAKEVYKMTQKSMAAFNGREIPKEDKNFAASGKANAAIAAKGKDAIINATVGALYDDDANLVVMKSVEKTIHALSGPDFAAYAPIAGIPGFRAAIVKAALGSYEPKSIVKAVATPGGTGSIRNAVDNYSCPGDKILTHNWYWGPYKNIANELGRDLETFEMFDEAGNFNIEDFRYKVSKLLRNQEHLVIILNTPASNPTGYSLSMEDWQGVKSVLDEASLDKKIALVCDVAYIDFAGEEAETRAFLKVIDNLRSNVLPIIAYSASKTFTMYGFRCAAMICMAHSQEAADEFEKLCSFSARSTWSNSPRAPQTVIEKIYADPALLEETNAERKYWRDKLLARGRAFEEEAKKAGLPIVPFRAGFFVTIPYADPDALCNALNEKDVFLIPVSGGVRVSVASIHEANCRKIPAIIKETMEAMK